MDPEPLKPEDARAALDGIEEARRELARKATAFPLWRHAAFGAIMAMFVLGQDFGPPLQIVLPVGALAATFWLAADDRRRHGMFINGYRKGLTLIVSVALLAAMLGGIAFEVYARLAGLSLAVKLGIAMVAFLVALESSYAWNRAYRRELMNETR
ncbi:hypothetical protein KRZ98_16450 [Sphingobium sp. AS12]|uniref:hypothetical protein n=1 Tax=Sphingobium sp. AS12 TaxID=2849495 RepID=UPI001C313284|nr:hypothetical protein [Sphingobium sp. AS12]MBV2149838.1 hypothetical protein [Sphingobium sp. AS12]